MRGGASETRRGGSIQYESVYGARQEYTWKRLECCGVRFRTGLGVPYCLLSIARTCTNKRMA